MNALSASGADPYEQRNGLLIRMRLFHYNFYSFSWLKDLKMSKDMSKEEFFLRLLGSSQRAQLSLIHTIGLVTLRSRYSHCPVQWCCMHFNVSIHTGGNGPLSLHFWTTLMFCLQELHGGQNKTGRHLAFLSESATLMNKFVLVSTNQKFSLSIFVSDRYKHVH